MSEIIIKASQTPGIVTFDNYEEVKEKLEEVVGVKYKDVDYNKEGIDVASTDFDELKKIKSAISDKQKELKKAYSAPYETVDKMLSELLSIVDPYYKSAKNYIDTYEKESKHKEIMDYSNNIAQQYGEVGKKIIESPAFFNTKWLNKTCKPKNYQDEINEKITKAVNDVNNISAVQSDNALVLMARFYETLSMNDVKSFMNSLNDTQEQIDPIAVESENNVLGYKILKITATEDQMASIMDQLEMMGVEVEEVEDGMPKPMEELEVPNFDSFVAFDIETSGTNGAASGDGEAQITEIGAVRVVNGVVVDKFDQLANPGRKIVPRIARLTHITDEMVANQPPVEEVIKMFQEFVGDSTLVGHNIKSSDLRYITKAANKAGVSIKGPFLDTYLLAKIKRNKDGRN